MIAYIYIYNGQSLQISQWWDGTLSTVNNIQTGIYKTMRQQQPSQSEVSLLTQIIEHANQRYLHQSRIHKNSSFNILRILSAYKEMCEGMAEGHPTNQHHGSSGSGSGYGYEDRKDCQAVYNWIIYITRNWNPQQYGDWIMALREISGHGSNGRKSRGSDTSMTAYGYTNSNSTNMHMYTNPPNSNNISRSGSTQGHPQQQRKPSTKQPSQSIIYSHNNTNTNINTNINNNNNKYRYSYNTHKQQQQQQQHRTNEQFSNTYTYNLEDYEESIYNKHLADVSVTGYNLNNPNSNYSYHNYSSNNVGNRNQRNQRNQRRMRDMLNQADENQFKLIPPVSSKLHHYISFEPESQNKENINSANTQNDQNKSENMNQPTRTPGEQSFIHNLPSVSYYGSPFILSKITNNTKEVTEVEAEQDDEDQTVQWLNMKARADIFYAINIKVKVFSGLLANFQAFQSFQEVLRKTKKFKRRLCFTRFHKAATQFLWVKKQKDQLFSNASNTHNQTLLKKSLKILKLLRHLKIKSPKQIRVHKFNPTSFQFLITLIFNSAHSHAGNDDYDYDPLHRNIHDTPKSIREKSRYFQSVEDSQRMGIISEYFMGGFRVTREQVRGLFDMHRIAKKRKVWAILANNVRLFGKQQQSISTLIKRSALTSMLKCHKKSLSNRSRISMMQTSRNHLTKQKCFNALCEFQASKKIYQKREQFLKNCHLQTTMKSIFKEWVRRKEQLQVKKLGRNVCVERGTTVVLGVVCKRYFGDILDYVGDKKLKEAEEVRENNRAICSSVFQFLKSRAKQRKLHMQIKVTKNMKIQKNILKIWLKLTKISLSLKRLNRLLASQAYSAIKQESNLSQKYSTLSSYLVQQRHTKMLKQLRICTNLDKLETQQKTTRTHKQIQKFQLATMIRIISKDIQSAIKHQKLLSIEANQLALKKYIEARRKREALGELRQSWSDQIAYRKKEGIVAAVMGQRRIVVGIVGGKEGDALDSGSQTYTRCHIKMKRQVFDLMREDQEFRQNCFEMQNKVRENCNKFLLLKLLEWRRQTKNKSLITSILTKKHKKTSTKLLQNLSLIHKSQLSKSSKSQSHYEKSLKFKTLLGLANSVIYHDNLTTTLQNKIRQDCQLRQGRIFINNLKDSLENRRKMEKLGKFVFVNMLAKFVEDRRDIQEKQAKLVHMLKRNHVKRIPFSRLLSIQNKISNEFLEQAYKKFAIMKVNRALIRHILHQKQLYMAIKFKALHLCRLSFKSLLLNREQNNTTLGLTLGQSKKFKIHQHISTSYSSI